MTCFAGGGGDGFRMPGFPRIGDCVTVTLLLPGSTVPVETTITENQGSIIKLYDSIHVSGSKMGVQL